MPRQPEKRHLNQTSPGSRKREEALEAVQLLDQQKRKEMMMLFAQMGPVFWEERTKEQVIALLQNMR